MKGCPDGYSQVDDDETGKCFPDTELRECEGGGHVKIGDRCWNDPPLPEACPAGMDAVSLACAAGISVEDYCKKNPTTDKCPGSEKPAPITPVPEPQPTDYCYPLMGVLPQGCENENENFQKPGPGNSCNTGFIYVPKSKQCVDRDVFHDFDELDPRCQNNINQVCSYDGTIYPVCDNVTVQECYDLEDNVICEINTNRHECEVEEPESEPVRACTADMTVRSVACSQGKTVEEFCRDNPSIQDCSDQSLVIDGPQPITPEPEPQQQQQLPPCSAITTPAGPCLNDQGQQDMKMCTTSMHVSSIACKQGKTAEQVCADNPSTEGCPGAEQRITEPITPVPEPEPTPITPKPQPQTEPPLPDPGMILPPPEVGEGEDTEEEDTEDTEQEEQNNENENEESGGAEEEGGGGESDSDGDSSGSEGGA